jgi:hypothetical protein
VRAVKLLRVGRIPHLFSVPLGKGMLLGYDGVCRRCELRFGVEITDYPALEEDKGVDLVALVRRTNPRLLAGNDVAAAAWQRMSGIREPLANANRALVQHYVSGTRYDAAVAVVFAASLVVPIALAFATSHMGLPGSAAPWLGMATLAMFAGGLAWSALLTRSEPRRYFRKHLLQPLIEELRRLGPGRDELEACLSGLRAYEYAIADMVSTESLRGEGGPAPAPAVPAVAARKAAPSPGSTLQLEYAGKAYRFSPGVATIVIGRAKENAIVAGSKFVSRSHVQIDWPAGGPPRLKNLSRTGASLRPDGTAQAMNCTGEIALHGSGAIALCEDFPGAESRGDVVRYSVSGVSDG